MKTYIKITDIDYYQAFGKTTCTITYKVQLKSFPPVLRRALDNPRFRGIFNEQRYSIGFAKCYKDDTWDAEKGKKVAFCKARKSAYGRLRNDLNNIYNYYFNASSVTMAIINGLTGSIGSMIGIINEY